MAKSVLLIYAHPTPNRSKLNKQMFDKASALSFVEGRDLYELYPNLHVDVAMEQEALRRCDAVVFQFPLYWYSAPAVLKEWIDTVLKSGFSHGEGERVLKGMPFMLAVSTGSPAEFYKPGDVHGSDLAAFLLPLEQTARFCDMEVVDPFIVQGVSKLDKATALEVAEQYVLRLAELGA